MAVVYIQEFPIENRSTENYDFVAEKIGDGPFEGLIAHSAGFDDEAGVLRISRSSTGVPTPSRARTTSRNPRAMPSTSSITS